MPAPLAVDWQAVQMLARDVGVREAARQMELSEDSVKSRCTREGWFKDINAIAADPKAAGLACLPASMRPKSTAPSAPNVAQIHRKMLSELGEKTRFRLAKSIHRASKAASKLSPDDALTRSGEVLTTAKAAQVVHGWRGAEATATLRLEVLAQSSHNRESEPLTIDDQVTVERVEHENGAETGQDSDEL